MQDIAREQGKPYEPDRPDNIHRLNMGVFPKGARHHPEPVQQDPRLQRRASVHFVPGLSGHGLADDRMGARHHYAAPVPRTSAYAEKSVIVFGAMEATLTPLMEQIERDHPGVKVFSLPSVDHPAMGPPHRPGRQGRTGAVEPAYAQLLAGLRSVWRRVLAPNWCDSAERTNKVLDRGRTSWGAAHPKVQGSRREKALKIGDNRRGFAGPCHAPALAQNLHSQSRPILLNNHPLGELDGSQDRRRRDEDGEGERSQVRRLPLHRHPRQGTARHRARFGTSTKTSSPRGHAFDGSSIAGWKGIEASDMLLMPDPNTANIDPFFEETDADPAPAT